jgi:Leucine-rich repeat (LRR) protein
MPLKVFEKNGKYGLKNKSEVIVIEPEFDEIVEGESSFLAINYNEKDDEQATLEVISLDPWGDYIASISDSMRNNGYPDFGEIYHLCKDLYVFMTQEYSGSDVNGLFNKYGVIVLQPKFDEIHEIEERVLLGFYSMRSHDFETDWEQDGTFVLFDIHGRLLWEAPVTGGYEIEGDDDDLIFDTYHNEKILVDKNGKAKHYSPPDFWVEDLHEWAAKNDIFVLQKPKEDLLHIKVLDFTCEDHLRELPEEIGNLINVEKLVLSGTANLTLPQSIGNLVNLTELYIEDSGIRKLPEAIGKLRNLRNMQLSYSRLVDFPESISFLDKLEEINLSWTHFERLPETIGALKSLRRLDCYKTSITELPESIGGLCSLKYLNLSESSLRRLPDSIGELTKLEYLNLSECKLSELPSTIGNLRSLTELRIDDNDLYELPVSIGLLKNLTILDLSHNSLVKIPASIGDLIKLTRLFLSGNNYSRLPESIGDLNGLTHLHIDCKNLAKLPVSISNLLNLNQLSLSSEGRINLPPAFAELVSKGQLNISCLLCLD